MSGIGEIASVSSYLRRIGAGMSGRRTAVVREEAGKYWTDVAVIRFDRKGKVDAPGEYAPNKKEAKRIRKAIKKLPMPPALPYPVAKGLPGFLSDIDEVDRFEFLDESGENILMIQERKIDPEGNKRYVPWSYWEDGEWVCAEPEWGDGKVSLPLWGLERTGESDIVFIHEGAKSARRARDIADGKVPGHPFAAELSGAVHVGWVGGALNPHRTDWTPVKGFQRAYIVPDNDAAGYSAVPKIARLTGLRGVSISLEFSAQWPHGFDLGDDFPDEFFRSVEGVRYYTGPSFRSLWSPATYMTTAPKKGKRGRPRVEIREQATRLWAYVEEADSFVCRQIPGIMRTGKVFNNMVRPFSQTENTASLLVRAYAGRNVGIAYRPGQPRQEVHERVVDRDVMSINMHVPPLIPRSDADYAPFTEFLKYLVPGRKDREELSRWLATLIARPDIRMGYGVLMISETQGVGKSMLGERILAPLIGHQNTSYPSEATVMGSFNDWCAYKRLAVVHEIYQGSSWKTYNALKSTMTDRIITVNRKYVAEHQIENWLHIYACSNSFKALRMDQSDRRWLCPVVTETLWGRKRYGELINWLDTRGLGAIKRWAEEWKGGYVKHGRHAPYTRNKEEIALETMSDAERLAVQLGDALASSGEPIALDVNKVMDWVKQRLKAKVYETNNDIKKAMVSAGAIAVRKRVRSRGLPTYFVVNEAGERRLNEGVSAADEGAIVRGIERASWDVFPDDM